MPAKRHSHGRGRKLPWFGKRKTGRRRIAAARLDLEGESTGTALGRASNRIALILLGLFLLGLIVWTIRTTDWQELRRTLAETITPTPAPPAPAEEELPPGGEVPLFEPRGDPEAIARLTLALNAAQIGRHEEAQILLREAEALDPRLIGLHYVRGLLAWSAGDSGQARLHFQESISQGEAVAMASSRLGDIAMAMNDIHEAVLRYQRVIELYPGDAWIQLKLGIALRRDGRAAASLPHFRLASRLRPAEGNFHAWEALAQWDLAGRPRPLPARTTPAPAWHLLDAVDHAQRGDMEAAATALRTFNRLANPALRELAAADPVAIELAAHDTLRPLVPTLPRLGKVMTEP